jgi:hypothetical protein
MKHFCIIIDSQRGYSQLDRCLASAAHAANTIASPVDVVVLTDRRQARFAALAERYNARLMRITLRTRGQRYNACANSVSAGTLIFVDSLVEIPAGWLAWAERALFERHWDAVALTLNTHLKSSWLTRLFLPEANTLVLSVQRPWFERVGGFDTERVEGVESDLLARLGACNAKLLNRSLDSSKAAAG